MEKKIVTKYLKFLEGCMNHTLRKMHYTTKKSVLVPETLKKLKKRDIYMR